MTLENGQKNILITGAAGFIGSALGSALMDRSQVIGVDVVERKGENSRIFWEQGDLADGDFISGVIEHYLPDVIIHCAGIAHQKAGSVDLDTYMRINSVATEHLAKVAARVNPSVRFIFLSSVSVYGEDYTDRPITENSHCNPSSDYACSKLDAERRLASLHDSGVLHNLTVLRLAPVYDREWSLNLDRRVLAPKQVAYLKFGSGRQQMSALARPNLVELIIYYIENMGDYTGKVTLNVCDMNPYEFKTIIDIFQQSHVLGNKPVIDVPLSCVWLATRAAGILIPGKKRWLHACFDKLSKSLIFDNGKMLSTGFAPRYSLENIFSKSR